MTQYGEEIESISTNYTEVSKTINLLVSNNLHFP